MLFFLMRKNLYISDDLAKLISQPKSSISRLSAQDFDPRGQYRQVVDTVGKATGGKDEITIFRITGPGARAEYWIVGVAKGGGKVIGLKVAAVES